MLNALRPIFFVKISPKEESYFNCASFFKIKNKFYNEIILTFLFHESIIKTTKVVRNPIN